MNQFVESRIRQEAASQGINKTVTMIANAMNVNVPYGPSPSERREILISIITSRL